MHYTHFPDCCGVEIYHDFFEDTAGKLSVAEFQEDFEHMDNKYASRRHFFVPRGQAFDLIILTEHQYGGAKAGLEKRGFKELGPRVRNDNSGNYLVLLQRINGKVKTTGSKSSLKKKSKFL